MSIAISMNWSVYLESGAKVDNFANIVFYFQLKCIKLALTPFPSNILPEKT